MANVLLYTCMIGAYDKLHEIPTQTNLCDAVCFTDRDLNSLTWKIERVGRMFPRDPILSARYLKIAQTFPGYEICIYMDAAFEIISADFIELMVAGLKNDEAVFCEHPHRNCLFQEINVCRTIPRFKGQPLRRQSLRYRLARMPKNYGLWATGCFAFRNDKVTHNFRQAWWEEVTLTSNRDQISLPYIVRKQQFLPRMKTLSIDVFENPYIKWFAHIS